VEQHSPILLGEDMNYKKRSKDKKSFKDKIIKRQINEIESLKETISNLELDSKQKEDLMRSIEIAYSDLLEAVNELKRQRDKYEKLTKELVDMKNTMNIVVFKGKWKLIRWLMK
jgi:DNA repair exonuclease SbcCD ATPase subunit